VKELKEHDSKNVRTDLGTVCFLFVT